MSHAAITVENLSKAYRIGLKEEIPDTLVGAAAAWMCSPLKNLNRLSRLDTFGDNGDSEDTIWALRDVSFEVQQGEVVGIIGRNGAGKSTLLKILSRITDPTTGRAIIRGRVSSLLEVGTGFHPELSGRENIYMNGTILGMTKREIDRKFDEIVDFSGVEKFLDTPIKRYSSGMKVRLAFSVAAHLEPEILIIDEVLAVGDAAFQKKCLGKMQHVAAGGRTILFVSHNLSAVQSLCNRGIALREGSVLTFGTCDAALDAYLSSFSCEAKSFFDRGDRTGKGNTRITNVVIDRPDAPGLPVSSGRPSRIAVTITPALPRSVCRFTLYDELGRPVANFDSSLTASTDVHTDDDTTFKCCIDALPLVPGRYSLNISIDRDGEIEDRLENALFFDVHDGLIAGRRTPRFRGYGSVAFPHVWTIPHWNKG